MKKKLYRIKLAIVWILMVILAPILIPLLWIVEGENPFKPKYPQRNKNKGTAPEPKK